jgi:hypothetical protein
VKYINADVAQKVTEAKMLPTGKTQAIALRIDESGRPGNEGKGVAVGNKEIIQLTNKYRAWLNALIQDTKTSESQLNRSPQLGILTVSYCDY